MASIGFIMLRHVNTALTDKYWKLSYECVRKYYPENLILIIDDGSNYDLVDKEYEKHLYKTTIIRSEFTKRGEFLPFYYYLSNKLFDIAVIIHDSVFINTYIDFSVTTYKFIWEFEHDWDQKEDEINIIKQLNNSEQLLKLHANKELWKGCFGAMIIITHDYLKKVDNIYDLSRLVPYITTKYNRKSFERVIACMLQSCGEKDCLLGNLHNYCKWGITYKYISKYKHLPIIKVWTGR